MSRTIGTTNETSLHRQLKLDYAGRGGRTEVEVAGFVVDGVSADGRYVEVQTGSFSLLRKKAKTLAALGGLKVIYPVAVVKYLEVFDAEGGLEYRRKSSRPGNVWDLFAALVYAPELPRIPSLEIELALVEVAEERVRDGKGSWRRKGLSVRDRRMLSLRERVCLKTPGDYLCFVPFAKGEEFTAADFAKKARIRVRLANKALHSLTSLVILERIGKRRNAYVYRLIATSRTKKWKKQP